MKDKRYMMANLYQNNRLSLLIFLSILILFSCSGQLKLQEGEEKIVSEKKKPGWLFQIGKDFVVGYSGKFEAEKEARANALWDARKKIIERLGMKLTITQQENLYERTSQLDDEIVATHVEGEINTEAISKGLISVKAKEYYIEKYAKKSFGEIKYYYLAFVLVPFSKEEHDNLIKNTFEEIENRYSDEFDKIASLKSDIKSLLIHFSFLEKLAENAKEIIGLKADLTSIVDGWLATIQKEKLILKENIHVALIGANQPIGINRKLTESIGVKLKYHDLPISNVTIELFKKDKKITQGFTDEKGEYLFLYQKPVIGDLEIAVHINFNEDFQISPVHFQFQNPIKVVISIPELNAKGEQNKRIVQNSVVEYLLQNGIVVDQSISLDQADVIHLLRGRLNDLTDELKESGDLLLVGRSYVQNASALPMNEKLFQAQSGCELKLIDPVNESIEWNIALTQDFVLGRNRLEAGDKSLIELSKKLTKKIKEYLIE